MADGSASSSRTILPGPGPKTEPSTESSTLRTEDARRSALSSTTNAVLSLPTIRVNLPRVSIKIGGAGRVEGSSSSSSSSLGRFTGESSMLTNFSRAHDVSFGYQGNGIMVCRTHRSFRIHLDNR